MHDGLEQRAEPAFAEKLIELAFCCGHVASLGIQCRASGRRRWQKRRHWGPEMTARRARNHSPTGSRAPRTVMTAMPPANTRLAQIAAPTSCDGRAGQIHGVVRARPCHCVYSA